MSTYRKIACVFSAAAFLGLALLSCNSPSAIGESPTVEGEPVSPDQVPSSTITSTVLLPVTIKGGESTPGPASLDVVLTVANPPLTERTAEPVTSGVPVPESVNLTDLSSLRLLDENGQPIAAQFSPLARWGGAPSDQSKPVRWLLLDFQADVPPESQSLYRLVDSGGQTPSYPTLTVTDGADAVTVDTGVAQFSISKADGNLTAPGLGSPMFGQLRSNTTYETGGPVAVLVALEGPMRVSVHVQGVYQDSLGSPLLDYTSRYWFYAGQPTIHLFHTLENNTLCPLVEYGQPDCYNIGDDGGVEIADLSLIVPTDLGENLTYRVGVEGEPVIGNLTGDLTLYQDSSGSDYWDTYPTFTDWDGSPIDTRPRMQANVSFRGYRTTLAGSVVDSGDRASGWLIVTGSGGSWTVGVIDFWQNFPKALRLRSAGTVEIGLFPDEFGVPEYNFTLRAGEHKTHEILLSPSTSIFPSPLFAQAPPEWYVNSGALGLTALRNWNDWPEHEQYLDYQLTTSPEKEGFEEYFNNIFDAIAGSDFYGIFDYGDWPLDYEGFEIAPLNNKYDYDYGMWLQWARGGDPRWFDLAAAADRHYADVDILHNLHSPRHWADGIAFGHSYHDEDGITNPHRNNGGNHPDTAFGTPGLTLYYYLTGYEKAYESALELADCIEYRLHNDSYLCSYFSDCSGEGYALGDGLYDAGSRPAANSLSIAVAAYRATADSRYLAVADALVDWARASNQPFINGPTGEDQMMRPWMLNMYMRALSDYIEMRDEFNLPDTHNAAGSYLAFADWLHTYAWLDLEPVDTGPRAAYPYEWWFDGRQGDPNDEWSVGNNVPSINNWLLLGADAMSYAHHLSGETAYLDWGAALFRTGSRDPWYEGDLSFYSESKQVVNSVAYGHIFLHEWAGR